MKNVMKRAALAAAAWLALTGAARAEQTISGAGATFPYPIYAKWAYSYEQATKVKVNYQSIGSGGGIAQIKAKTVDFGASDAPLSAADLDKSGLFQFPMVIGGVVPAVNIPGIKEGQLKLTAELLANIFLGSITKWDDPAIKSANPGLSLPSKAITVVHRADGSGTTWVFTNYLSKVSTAWKARVGFATSVEWPCGVGGKGNEGVAAYVKRIAGSIGYVEYAYSLQNKIPYAQMRNREGKFVSPDITSFQAAAANADWAKAPGFYVVLTDQPGEASWPITGATFILVHKERGDAARAKSVLDFFNWCYENGDADAEKLHYIPMPGSVVELVRAAWKRDLTSGGQAVWK